MCDAVWFVLLQVALATAHPLFLLSPGAVARLALAEYPIMVGCAICCVAYAVCGGRVNLVGGWFVAQCGYEERIHRAHGRKHLHYFHPLFLS